MPTRDHLCVLMMPDYRSDNPYQTLLADALEKQGVDVTFPVGYRRVLPITRALQDTGCNVLHLHWPTPYIKGETLSKRASYAAKLLLDLSLARIQGVRIVWTVHNVQPHKSQYPALERYVRAVIAQVAHKLIVHDPNTRDKVALEYRVPWSKVEVIPHGHYRDYYGEPPSQPEARRILNLPKEGRLFLHLGMLRPYKGTDELLDSWKKVAGQYPEAHLVIAGQPESLVYRNTLAEKCRSCSQIIFRPGFVDDNVIPAYFAAANVAVFPFRRITTSGSLVLAISYDVPVIAPRYPGLDWVLGDANDGLYDPDSGTPGLQNKLLQALQVSGTSNDQMALRTARKKLSWDPIGKNTIGCYIKEP